VKRTDSSAQTAGGGLALRPLGCINSATHNRYGHRSQDADDEYDHHQLYKCETLSTFHFAFS
jgi:hypothetical protein